MPQIFRPGADTIARVVLVAIPVTPLVVVAFLYGLSASPYITGETVTLEQPVPFSHDHHVAELGIDCRYCHSFVESSPVAGVPPTTTCMSCHSQIWTQAALLAPVRQSLADRRPIHWRRVNRLPDYVYFDHSIHIAKGVGCTTCHGPIQEMRLTRQVAPMTMGWCLDCHRDPSRYLRPKAAIFDTRWTPPEDQDKRGPALVAQYHINTGHLTDCSVCHR